MLLPLRQSVADGGHIDVRHNKSPKSRCYAREFDSNARGPAAKLGLRCKRGVDVFLKIWRVAHRGPHFHDNMRLAAAYMNLAGANMRAAPHAERQRVIR